MIHVVGPVWNIGNAGEPRPLASCYRNALTIAAAYGARTIAFPAISTGAFGYPMRDACDIAVATVLTALTAPETEEIIDRVTFSMFDQAAAVSMQRALDLSARTATS